MSHGVNYSVGFLADQEDFSNLKTQGFVPPICDVKQYRPALNRAIENAFNDHNKSIGRTGDPKDLVWFELELNRHEGNKYSISLPEKFIELPKEIKEDKCHSMFLIKDATYQR